MLTEEWKLCPGFSKYKVSNFGRIINNKTYVELKPCNGSHGYPATTLREDVRTNEKGKPVLIYRLVARAFVPNPLNKPEINHKDGDKWNSRADNLEWVTHRENMQHAFETGLIVVSQEGRDKIAAANRLCVGSSRVNACQVRLVNTGEIFESIGLAAKAYNCQHSQISRCCNQADGALSAGKSPITGKPLIWEFAY